MSELISIIVPIYNAEKYLEKCITSIMNQSHKNIEILLINDGSIDSSLEICNHFASIDNRIRIINKKNEGVSRTRNLGINLAKGKFIGFIDSDDYIQSTMYETMLHAAQTYNLDVVTLMNYVINKESNVEKKAVYTNVEALEALFELKFPTSLWAYMYKKDLIDNLYLNEDIHFFEDFEFNFRVLNKCNLIGGVFLDLYNYMINPGSINSQFINDKKLTCLNIYMNISKDFATNNVLKKKSKSFRAHFLSSVILSLAKSYKNADIRYFDIVQSFSRKEVTSLVFSSLVPIKFKISILGCTISCKKTTYLINKIKY